MLLDPRQNINYDYSTMTGVPGGAPGGENRASFKEQRGPEIAETKQLAYGVWRSEAQKRLAYPADLTPMQADVLKLSRMITTTESPVGTIPKKSTVPVPDGQPPLSGTDLLIADDIPYQDAQGTQKNLEGGKTRISQFAGGDQNSILCGFHDENDQPVLGSDGKPLILPLSRVDIHSAQVASESAVYETLIPQGESGDVLRADLAVGLFEREQGPVPADLPSAAVRENVKQQLIDQSAAPDQQDAGPEQTPIQKADAIITAEIAKLIAKLEDATFNTKDNKEAVEKTKKLLFNLKVSLTAHGPSSAILKTFALQQLNDSGAGDFMGEIASLADAELEARINVKYAIDVAMDDPDSGINSTNDVDELQAMIDDGDVMKLLQDKRVKGLTNLAQEIFGRDTIDLKEILKDSNISPEIEKALKEAEESGDKSKIWWILLALVGAPILGVGVGGVGIVSQGLAQP